jgi:hypothetical protein
MSFQKRMNKGKATNLAFQFFSSLFPENVFFCQGMDD